MAVDYRINVANPVEAFARGRAQAEDASNAPLRQRAAQLGIAQQEQSLRRGEQQIALTEQESQMAERLAAAAQKDSRVQEGLITAYSILDQSMTEDGIDFDKFASARDLAMESMDPEMRAQWEQISQRPLEDQAMLASMSVKAGSAAGLIDPKMLEGSAGVSGAGGGTQADIQVTDRIRALRETGDSADARQADMLESLAMKGKIGATPEEQAETARKKKFAEKSAEAGAELLAGYVTEAAQASAQRDVLGQMRSLLDEGVPTGPLSGRLIGIKAFADDLGIPVDTQKLGGQEAFRAIGNQLALRLRNPDSGFGLTGSTSDRDLAFLKESIPGAVNSEAGNAMLLKLSGQVIEHKIRIAKVAEAYADRNGSMRGWTEYLDNWKEENPIFSESDKAEAQSAFSQEAEEKEAAPITPERAAELEAKYGL